MSKDMETVTLEIPVEPDENRICVDALFTALDHASAYHNHDETSNYVELYNNMEGEFRDQIDSQL